MTDSSLNAFLARGPTTEREAFTPDPPTPASGPAPAYLWDDTTLGGLFVYDFGRSAWAPRFSARIVQLAVTDPSGAAIAVATGLQYFRVPAELSGMNLVEVAATVTTVSTSGDPAIQLTRIRSGAAAAMLSIPCSIDANETDSSTAVIPAVIDAANDDVATADLVRVDVTAAGTDAKGLIVTMVFQ